MKIDIKKLDPEAELPYGLLYLADPSREAVEDYTRRGECWGAYRDGEIVGVYVLLPTRPFTTELVNIAVAEELHGQRIGGQLLRHAVGRARESGFRKIEVGTATIGFMQIAFYQGCGFRMEWIDRDFFIKHYDGPIIDEGRECRDMIRFGMEL